MSEKINHNTIPWSLDVEWDQVFLSIKKIEKDHGKNCTMLYEIASDIQINYEKISDAIEMVCSHTCTRCEDICCIRATIWFDLKDLLYIYFSLKKFPESQIKKFPDENFKTTCCYFKKNSKLPSKAEPEQKRTNKIRIKIFFIL
jgi:hypothetical protein